MGEIVSRVHQGDVRKGLGEVAHQPTSPGVVLFRQQPDVIAQSKKTLEQCLGVSIAADQVIGIGQPEAAGQKHPFARRHAVLGRLRIVSLHKSVLEQLAFDSFNGRYHPRIFGRQETYRRDQQ